jgi:hypothetical protein
MVAVEEVQHLDSDDSAFPLNEKVVPFRPNQRLDRDHFIHVQEEATTFKQRHRSNVVMGQVLLGIFPPFDFEPVV